MGSGGWTRKRAEAFQKNTNYNFARRYFRKGEELDTKKYLPSPAAKFGP
jgi:hypothetical protein